MRPLFFMWIPRTGGTSLHNAILRLHPNRHIGASWTQNPGLHGIEFDDGSDYFVGHWPASVISRLPEGTFTLTILRDPVERVISHYHYVHKHGYHYDPAFTYWIKRATMRQWLDSPYSRRAANNLQTRFLCDREHDDLDRAQETLDRLDYAGITSALEDALNIVCQWWRVPDPALGHENEIEREGGIDDALLDELSERNWKDILLYEWALDADYYHRARA